MSSWLRTQLCRPDANGLAEAVPQVHEVGDDQALALLRFEPARQQSRADAAFDSRDLRFDQCALAIPVFVPECMDALVLDVPNEMIVPARDRLV
ncbi:hypothetical protein [Paraburkholderia sediminicola]|uniref:hypothetical protein n=1 Tax=Paraburkholderia sediminicola TaxID=458836 RepID=UPI0038B77B40